MADNASFGAYARLIRTPSSGDVVSGSGGDISLPGAVPRGLDWLTDTISGFDIYDMGFVKRPTIFFDPTATSSLNRGTFKHPYNTQAAVQLAVAGNMAGHVLGIKRGIIGRPTGTNGLVFTAHGEADNPFVICPYGDAEALPIITGAAIISTWTLVDATNNVWSYAIGATEHDAWQDDVRLWKKAWNTNAVTTLTAEGTSTYNSSTLYIRPYNGENPNLGQMESTVTDFALSLRLSDTAATGYVHLAGLDVRKSRVSALIVNVPSIVSVTSANDLQLAGMRASGAGVDSSGGTASDSFIIYGPSAAVRLETSAVRGCYAEGSLNNAFEYSYTDGLVHEFNQDNDHGGNHVEFWAANSNGKIRYNIGENHDTTGRVYTAFHKGGVWITSYADTGLGVDHTSNINNEIDINYFHNMAGQGIDVFGGTGNKIRHNTLHQDATYTTNRLINFATSTTAPGTVSCEISNNFVLAAPVGNFFALDIMSGGPANNAVGASITSTVTGDNNFYCSHYHASLNVKLRVNNTNYVASTVATYKAAVATFDANATLKAGTTDGGTYIESDGSPSATFPGIGTGKVSLTGIGNRYLHGEAYNPAAPTIGAMV